MSRSVIRHKSDHHNEVDDVVIDDVTRFRLERMDRGAFWIAAYREDDRVAFWLKSKTRIHITVNEDDFGCVDDSVPAGIGDNEGTP